jgi:hypothetical protein
MSESADAEDVAHGDQRIAAEINLDAAKHWHALGVVTEEAFALLGQDRYLVSLGKGAEARGALQRASEIFTNLGAAPSLEESRALLRETSSA